MVGIPQRTAIWLILVITLGPRAEADSPVDYSKEIKPVLKSRCYACHGALKQEAGLRLDSGRFLRIGGDTGAVILPGDPGQSRLMERITADDVADRMPPEGDPLSAERIAALRRWIAEGANSPDDEQPEADPHKHWAFQPPVRPAVPHSSNGEAQNPIDGFINATLGDADLSAETTADKSALLRRATLDLIGLPPTREELHAFLSDESPTAYESVVDRLLNDPRHGERWARHWMDVWRYSDWYGRRHVPDVWNSASQIWRWRDWIVRSLNADHGYDRMLREMLAADEICPEDHEARVATGYLVRNWYALNPNDWMRNTVEHTGKAFLGLTFHCAHCHDHKYDPISQEDYFRLRAFFEPMYVRQDRWPGEADPGPFQDYEYSTLRKIQRLGAVSVFDKAPDAPTWFYTGGDERNRQKERGSIPPGVPTFLAATPLNLTTVELPPNTWYPGLRPEMLETVRNELQADIDAARRKLSEARQSESSPSPEALEAVASAERELADAIDSAKESGAPTALSGEQSLFFDAQEGRRILNNGVTGLRSLVDGTAIEFQLQLLSPAHFNFQLARHADQGLTAAYVGFDKGRIVSYRPGSFVEFDIGAYDFAAAQRRFHVHLILKTEQDECLLTIKSLTDDELLVDRAPVALNGWNPIGDRTKTVTFDAHPGSVAVVDDIRISPPSPDTEADIESAPFLEIDFEPPVYAADLDVVGTDGWTASPFCSGSANSLVRTVAANEAIEQAKLRLVSAQRRVREAQFPLLTAEASLAAAQAELVSLNARVIAEQARITSPERDDLAVLKQTAGRREREANFLHAEADLFAKEQALASAESLPADDANRQKALESAQMEFAAAADVRASAKSALESASTSQTYTPLGPDYARTSTGRRKALAMWITDRSHPLTARVAVNHIWLRHFHKPLVATVDNFGRSGATPTHPGLLDWLAVEFMESDWSMKHLHRLIVTSDVYQRRSGLRDPGPSQQADADNALLWRMNTGRMEAEVVRDSLLSLGGMLDETIGGQELENDESLTTFRRSLYYATFPEQGGKSPLGELFDGPDAIACYRRTRSIVPQQALALTNSHLVHDVSQRLAQRLWSDVSAEASSDQVTLFIRAAFEHVLARQPSSPEIRACHDFLMGSSTQADERSTAESDARKSLLRALLNHNDFVTIR